MKIIATTLRPLGRTPVFSWVSMGTLVETPWLEQESLKSPCLPDLEAPVYTCFHSLSLRIRSAIKNDYFFPLYFHKTLKKLELLNFILGKTSELSYLVSSNLLLISIHNNQNKKLKIQQHPKHPNKEKSLFTTTRESPHRATKSGTTKNKLKNNKLKKIKLHFLKKFQKGGKELRWQRNRTGRPLSPLQIHRKNNSTQSKLHKTTSDR